MITIRLTSVWQHAHPVEVFQFGRRAVPESLHCLDWRITEVGGFSIYHLYDHDPQGPDIHLWETMSHTPEGQVFVLLLSQRPQHPTHDKWY